MKWLAISAFLVCLGSAAWAESPVPRPAKELVAVDPAGKQLHLSAFKGKVVLIQFLSTTCMHCQAAARMYSKLQTELGPKGFQAFGVAFNEESQAPEAVRFFAMSNGVTFPVGAAPRDAVLGFLGISVMTPLRVPQIAIVDPKGVVRVQSASLGSPELQDETQVRALILNLLKP